MPSFQPLGHVYEERLDCAVDESIGTRRLGGESVVATLVTEVNVAVAIDVSLLPYWPDCKVAWWAVDGR